jgi:hypothetical protein
MTFYGGRQQNKYRARKTPDGFDSEKERNRYSELRLLERSGYISDLRRQVRFEIIPKQYKDGHKMQRADYIADFVYHDNRTGKQVVEDVKGYRGGEAYRLFVLKKKLMLERLGIWVEEI